MYHKIGTRNCCPHHFKCKTPQANAKYYPSTEIRATSCHQKHESSLELNTCRNPTCAIAKTGKTPHNYDLIQLICEYKAFNQYVAMLDEGKSGKEQAFARGLKKKLTIRDEEWDMLAELVKILEVFRFYDFYPCYKSINCLID